jgi:molybdopterin molybdotransferase
VRSGAVVVETETIVRTAEIAALAAVGCKRVSVFRPPHVSVLSTGDELVEVESAPADHQVRNSNARMLVAQLRAMQIHARNLGIARDDTAALDAMLEEGLRSEVFILSGGVSVGAYDLVGAALIRAGCEILFHNVSMRPGKPILAAKRGSCLIFGLPGNPLSAFTGCRVFVLPVLRRLMGDSKPVPPMVPATLGAPLRRKPGRLSYHLATLRWAEGKAMVTPVSSSSSGDVFSLVRANSFIVEPGGFDSLAAGAEVDVLPWID